MWNVQKDLEAKIKQDLLRMYPSDVIKKYGIVSTYVHDLKKKTNPKKK